MPEQWDHKAFCVVGIVGCRHIHECEPALDGSLRGGELEVSRHGESVQEDRAAVALSPGVEFCQPLQVEGFVQKFAIDSDMRIRRQAEAKESRLELIQTRFHRLPCDFIIRSGMHLFMQRIFFISRVKTAAAQVFKPIPSDAIGEEPRKGWLWLKVKGHDEQRLKTIDV